MLSNQRQIVEQDKFAYYPLGIAFEKQIKTIEDQGKKQINTLEVHGKQLVKASGEKRVLNTFKTKINF